MLKEELGHIRLGAWLLQSLLWEGCRPGSEKCKKGIIHFTEKRAAGRAGPKRAKETDILSWFARLTSQLWGFVGGWSTGFRISTTTADTAQLTLARFHGQSQVRLWLCGRSKRRRELQMSLVADPHIKWTQEQRIGIHSLQSRAWPMEVSKRGACRSRQLLIRTWLYSVPIAYATMRIWHTWRDFIRIFRNQPRRAAVCAWGSWLFLDERGTAWIWPYHLWSRGKTRYWDWTQRSARASHHWWSYEAGALHCGTSNNLLESIPRGGWFANASRLKRLLEISGARKGRWIAKRGDW